MKRLLVALTGALLGISLSSADALVLIRHDHAGPNVSQEASTHAEWVRWPAEFEPGSENGLLSICSGLDWEGERADLRFTSRGARTWVADNFRSLFSRGYLLERDLFLRNEEVKAVSTPSGSASQEELLLALGKTPTIHALPFPIAHQSTNQNRLLVYEAESWSDARRLASKAGGRSLVVEYPAPPQRPWTRFWRFGPGWPPADSIPVDTEWGVAGLLPLRSALSLVRHPERFGWRAQAGESRETVDRWLVHGHTAAPVLLAVWFWVALSAMVIALYLTATERRSHADRLLIQAVLLGPAADLIAGNLAHLLGLGYWSLLLVLSELALLGAATVLALLFRSLHPLFPAALLGLVAASACNPVWSSFSNVFRWPVTPISPEAVGCWIGYAAATYAFMREFGLKGLWLGRLATLAFMVASVAFNPWWIGGQASYVALPIIPLAAAEGLSHGLFLIVLALLPTSLAGLSGGLRWQPLFLTHSANEVGRANGALWARFLVSPGMLCATPVGAALAVFGSGFGGHRLKALIRSDPRRACVLWAAAGAAAMGITQPWMLYAALVLLMGGVLVLLYDAVD